MANKTFSRGVETLGAEASMVFVGNTKHNVPYMLKHSDLFEELPDKFHDSAFLDRIHFYIPGWEVDIIRGEMFFSNYGFVVDYLAEILRSMRNYDYSDRYQNRFTLSSDISTRDRDAIHKTFSGLMKILFPDGKATKQEIEDLLCFSMEGRKRVKDQLFRIDSTYAEVNFAYDNNEGISQAITTLEEEYPAYYYQELENKDSEATSKIVKESESSSIDNEKQQTTSCVLKEQHLVYKENQRGVSFDSLFGPYLKNAKKIVITDPYIRLFHQARNLMEFIETAIKQKTKEDELNIHLITTLDEFKGESQIEYLESIKKSASIAGIEFTWEFDGTNTIHARHIVTDTNWKISLDRGLDIFQHYEMNDVFSVSNRLQEFRNCKAFEVTFLRTK